MSWTEFFTIRLPHIYFVYGLAFFVLGVAVALEIGRAEPSRFNRMMWPLAFFGLVHGSHEWVEMFMIVGRQTYGFQPSVGFEIFRLVLLAVSFAALIVFGVQVLWPSKRPPQAGLWGGLGMLLLCGLGVVWLGRWLIWPEPGWFAAADALVRYSLAIPGAVLTAWALLAQRPALLRLNRLTFANDLVWAALGFLLYGVIGQIFINTSPLFPSNVVNAEAFQHWFGIPVQLFRAAMASIIAIFIIRALRTFEFNRQQVLAAARRRVEEEISRRDALRQEFLHRIVETQEEERTRIARELHDEMGQVLTGLAIGLRGVQTSIDNPNLLSQQLSQLEEMAVQALSNMRHLVNELRPALLDDMGLPAALRQYVDNFTNLTGVQARLAICQDHSRLPGEIETVLFRITQEALTNIARHAQAKRAWIDLQCDDSHAILQIKDDGLGFDPVVTLEADKRNGWGLIGIQERVKLVSGDMQLQSESGKGTTLTVKVPLQNGRKASWPPSSN